MLKEDAVDIKKHFKNVEFLTFTASNGWLEKHKISYDIRKKTMVSALTKINRKITAAKRNIFLFANNTPYYPENYVSYWRNIKVVFFT